MRVETIRWENHPSRYIDPRHIDIWLPPSYCTQPETRFPVLYMHDGQNLFNKKEAFAKVDWGVVPAMNRLLKKGQVREAIIVGIWNTEKRFQELLPWKPLSESKRGQVVYRKQQFEIGEIYSDGYLKHLVEEVKPQIDAQFRTLSGQPDTFVMGSSMGGLISLYAISEYPQVFGGVGCVSTHWPILKQLMINSKQVCLILLPIKSISILVRRDWILIMNHTRSKLIKSCKKVVIRRVSIG